MESTNFTNPYFEYEPFICNYPVKILAVVSLIISSGGEYMIVTQSPKYMAKSFKCLIIYHIGAAGLIAPYFAWFSFPRLLLPYIAFHGDGFFTDWGIHQRVQAELVLCLLLGNLSAVGSIFYYRMDMLLPPRHILNNKIARCTSYFLTYPVLSLFSAPLIHIVTQEDQDQVKLELFEEYRYVHPDIIKTPVVCGHFGVQNPTTYIAVVAYPLAASYGLFVIFFCCANIFFILRKETKTMSHTAIKHHIEVFKALIGLVTTLGLIVILSVFPLIFLLFSQSLRADIFSYCNFLITLLAPASMLAWMFSYKPYRIYILRTVRRSGQRNVEHSQVVVIVSVHDRNSRSLV